MGSRNPDLICPPPSPIQAVTLSEMRGLRWIVTAHCRACGTRVYVDLGALAQLVGEDYVLWGKHPRCKAWVRWSVDRRCEGRVTFLAQSSQTGTVVPLEMSGMVRDAIELRSQASMSRR